MATFEDVVIIELMGRHAGWLGAAAALARVGADDPPHLILLPEAPVDEAALVERVRAIHAQKGICLIAAAEGACDAEGNYLAEKLGSGGADGSGQRVLSMGAGVAAYLGTLLQAELGLRCRQLRPNTLQRATSALAVAEADRTIAQLAGAAAATMAVTGNSDVMAGLTFVDGVWGTQAVALADVVGRTITVPQAMLGEGGMDVTEAFIAYAAPLIGAMPPAPLLWI
jgi:6-phosphofructokinase 1